MFPLNEQVFSLGMDDTDAPRSMCTTWIGALLARELRRTGMKVRSARLVRLNPTIPYRTRGNAAISLEVQGESGYAFELASALIEKYAVFSCENTHPGLVIMERKPPSAFYWKAVTQYCSVEEARGILRQYAVRYKGYKEERGLIGATAAVCSEFPDYTWELLAYRCPERFFDDRDTDPGTFLLSQELTSPHTWDTWDYSLKSPVCIPHTHDPVLYGIRGDSPFHVCYAQSVLSSESPDILQIWMTNQGTDAHLLPGMIAGLVEGRSYLVKGRVCQAPVTGEGGHVIFSLRDSTATVSCMAFEPTKKFRDVVRSLRTDDLILAAGSYLRGTLNLEKICIMSLSRAGMQKAPMCRDCNKMMTSAGTGKGYKCRRCGRHEMNPDMRYEERTVLPGWYEVPPGARRHLARPVIRGRVPEDTSYLPINLAKSTEKGE